MSERRRFRFSTSLGATATAGCFPHMFSRGILRGYWKLEQSWIVTAKGLTTPRIGRGCARRLLNLPPPYPLLRLAAPPSCQIARVGVALAVIVTGFDHRIE